MNSLFKYYDYRKFLLDYYEQRKAEAEFFSYRYMAGKIGIEHSSLIKIMKGVRHLPIKKIPGVVHLCSFSKEEKDYFEILVGFSRAKSPKESQFFFDKLQELRNVPRQKLQRSQFNFFRHWYYSAIWSLLSCYECTGDMKDLGQRLQPSVSEKAVREAIEELISLNLVAIDEQGVYRRTSNNIVADEQLRSVAKDLLLRKSCHLAADSIEKVEKEKRDIATLLIDIPEDKVDELKEMIQDFRKAIINRVNSYEKSDKVYQFSTQFFPLSK